MTSQFFILMKFELLVAVIIFVLLFIKLGSGEWKNKTVLGVVNILLLINFIAGFYMNHDGALFGNMFRTTISLGPRSRRFSNPSTKSCRRQKIGAVKRAKWIPRRKSMLERPLKSLCIQTI